MPRNTTSLGFKYYLLKKLYFLLLEENPTKIKIVKLRLEKKDTYT